MELLLIFLKGSLFFSFTIIVMGYVIYRFQFITVSSWKNGIKVIFTACIAMIKLIYYELTGIVPENKVINTALILSNDELSTLLEYLNRHPFDTPTIESYSPNSYGVLWLDITACGLVSDYRDAENEDIAKISRYSIQNFYIKTRGLKPDITILISSSNRLYFAIPLSNDGRKYLEYQKRSSSQPQQKNDTPEILEEEIHLSK